MVLSFSSNNLAKIKDGTYVVNLDEYESVGTLDSFACEW